MKDKPIYNLRTLWYLLSQSSKRLRVSEPVIYSQTSVLLADVSRWEGDIDFALMKARGITAVIIKCGQAYYPDPKFGTYWLAARAAGLPRGSYWFYDSRETPQKQAQLWADLIRSDPGEVMHFADFEEYYGGSYAGWQNFKVFLAEFQRLSGLPDSKIGIYTGYYYWIGKVPASEMPWFSKFRLWLASYNPASNVLIPQPWSNATTVLWQYTDHGDGVYFGCASAELDLNYYVNGDLAHFESAFGLIESESENGGNTTMDTWRVNVAGLNIRSGAGSGYGTLGTALGKDDLVFGSLDFATQWVHFNAIQRVGQPAQSLDGWCAAYPASASPYLVKVTPSAPTLPVLTISIDGGDLYESKAVDLNPL
jgi:GH25 family lysozyme M1 (1,4-beta-N-acetylmuramidase)